MNNVQLMGNLARDPKVSVTRTGKTLVRMTVACSETYRGEGRTGKRNDVIRSGDLLAAVIGSCAEPLKR